MTSAWRQRAVASWSSAEGPAARRMKMRVLVVEDDALVGDAVKRAIEEAGFAVDLVGTADLARTALRAEPFDLVVLDIGLPRESGLRLLQGLRSRGETLPV